MSKFVREIVDSINKEPELWTPVNSDFTGFTGVKSGDVSISGYGNTRVLSISTVKIKGNDQNISYLDRWVVEVAIKKWKHSATLSMMSER